MLKTFLHGRLSDWSCFSKIKCREISLPMFSNITEMFQLSYARVGTIVATVKQHNCFHIKNEVVKLPCDNKEVLSSKCFSQ